MKDNCSNRGPAITLSRDQYEVLSKSDKSNIFDAVSVARALVVSAEKKLSQQPIDYVFLNRLRVSLENTYALRDKLTGADLELTNRVLEVFDPLLTLLTRIKSLQGE